MRFLSYVLGLLFVIAGIPVGGLPGAGLSIVGVVLVWVGFARMFWVRR